MDSAILAWVAAHRAAPVDAVMVALSLAGSGGAVWFLIAAVRAAVRPRQAMAMWQAVLAVVLAWLVADAVLKPIVHRPRPPAGQVAEFAHASRTSSFPSAHAATSVAGAVALGAAWPAARVAVWTLAALIACSRTYLGLHYPSDVLAGAALGWALAWFVCGRTGWRRTAPGR
jgi:undecaprenyl-diphosphatase